MFDSRSRNQIRGHGLVEMTTPCHGVNTGSIPVGPASVMRMEHEWQCARFVSEKVSVQVGSSAPVCAVEVLLVAHRFGKADDRVRFPTMA